MEEKKDILDLLSALPIADIRNILLSEIQDHPTLIEMRVKKLSNEFLTKNVLNRNILQAWRFIQYKDTELFVSKSKDDTQFDTFLRRRKTNWWVLFFAAYKILCQS